MKRVRVLLVDDDLMVSKAIRNMLAQTHDVTIATSGSDALALLEKGDRLDVLILDVIMPEMSGLELYDELCKQRPDLARSIIFLSGGNSPADLERIADHAEGIARINLLLGDEPLPRKLGHIPTMAERALEMLRASLKAYIDHDVDSARAICDSDDVVDQLQDAVYESSIQAMIADPASIQRNTYLIWCAHNLERIADRCTNICERVVYTVTGHMDELNVSKY